MSHNALSGLPPRYLLAPSMSKIRAPYENVTLCGEECLLLQSSTLASLVKS